MQASLRVGRLGALTIFINYTWIFASVLVLWWVALLWLPENFPSWTTNYYWLSAVAVLVLYFLSVVLHESVHSAFAKTQARSVNLFPFGGAVPFRLQDVAPLRAIFAALAAPVFNLILGGMLVIFGNMIPGPDHLLGWLKALLLPLGWLNIWIGAFNMIPGAPFDGGLALAAGQYAFTADREGGLMRAQAMGRVATLVLVLLGAWRGLSSDLWMEALALVVLGWSAHEAATIGQQRQTLRGLLAQLKAADFMEASRPDDSVLETDTIADLVRSHPRFPPGTPLAVVNSAGNLVGVTTLAATERLMQGTWSSTPVHTIATPLNELDAVRPYTSLVDVLAVAHEPSRNASVAAEGAASSDEEASIPVVDNNRLLGSIDLARLQSFEAAGRQLGIEETLKAYNNEQPRGVIRSLGALIPAVVLLVVMALLGNIALRTDPIDLQEASPDPENRIVFSNFRPADGDIVGYGELNISVQVEGTSAIISATILIDTEAQVTELAGASPMTQTASVTLAGLTLGQHTARINVVTENGDRKNAQWRFRVDPRAGNSSGGSSTPIATAAASVSPAVPVDLQRYRPALGGRVPADTGDIQLSLDIKSTERPASAQFFLDGQELNTKVDPVGGTDGLFRAKAAAAATQAGLHTVRVEIVSRGGVNTTNWTFTALLPDANNAYFEETGYFVTQPFLSYWQQNGGLGLFGYPISDLMQETDEATGEVYSAQYFERARFEQHASLGNGVLLGRLGALIQEPEGAVQPRDGAFRFFPETGHNVSQAFLAYWEGNGGLAVFGYPITEERVEKNPLDGKEYVVQYFERNRFERHPEEAGTPFEVQLGLLGAQLYLRIYGP